LGRLHLRRIFRLPLGINRLLRSRDSASVDQQP